MEQALATNRPGSKASDPPLQCVGFFLAEPPDYFTFSMNTIFHRDERDESVTGCIIAATLLVFTKEIKTEYHCKIDQLPLCGISYVEVAQRYLRLDDEQFDELCYPNDVDLSKVKSQHAAAACYTLHNRGYVNWSRILDEVNA